MKPIFLSIAATAALWAGPALADQIDGHWCSPDGKHVYIQGPEIEIPSGRTIAGDYDRHGFRYVGPAGDPEHGQTIVMSQQSDALIHVWREIDGKIGPQENWRRCSVTS